MKILLVAINAKYIHTNLAVYSLRAYAKKYCNHIELSEFTINHSAENILKGIYKENADVIAFSCYIWNFEIVSRVVVELKKVQPKAKIWFGGPEVSFDAEEYLKNNNEVDGIIIGEGEQTFLELMEYYVEGKKELHEIPGLVYKNSAGLVLNNSAYNGGIIVTTARQPLSLNDIPFPYEDMETLRNKIIYYESSRGCPFSCSYCLSSIDKRVRLRDTQLVKKELKVFLDYGVPQVKFVDRTFNCNKRHAMEILHFIKEQDNQITNFHFEISADLLGEEEIEILTSLRPGHVQLEIGVQSTNPDTVAAIHRSTDFVKLSNNVRRIQAAHNIHQHLDLIAGLPLEDYEAFSKSFHDVYSLKPDQLQLGFLKVLKGSLMEEETKAYGIIYQNTPPYEVLFTNHITFDQLLLIKGVCEMIEIYYNSGQFIYSIEFMEHFFETPMQLYLELSDYYESTKQELLAHSRIRRYIILLDFLKERVLKLNESVENRELITLFEEIMLFDLYLRENMKSRPPFAAIPMKNLNIHGVYDGSGTDRKSVHMERFTNDIIASCKAGKPIKRENIIVFDYNHRDPLNKAAKITVIESPNVG